MSLFFLKTALVILKLVGRSTSETPLYIGGLFPMHFPAANAVKVAADLAVDHVNRDNDTLAGYELVMLSNETKGKIGVTLDALYYQLHNPPTKLMIVGSLYSMTVEPTAELTGVWNIIQVSYAGSSPSLSNRQKYPYLFRTIPSMEEFNPARLAFIRTAGWTRVATIHELVEPHTTTSSNLMKGIVEANLTLVAAESFVRDPSERVRVLKEKDARIIIGNFYKAAARRVFCEAYKQGMYGPKYVWLIIGYYSERWWETDIEDLDCTAEELRTALAGYFTVVWATLSSDPRPTASKFTAEQYMHQINAILNRTHVTPTSQDPTAYAYDAVWACALTLNKTINSLPGNKTLETLSYRDKEIADLWREEMTKTRFLGVSGPVAFNEEGGRKGVIMIEQDKDSKEVEIGRYYAESDDITWSRSFQEIWEDYGGKPPPDSDTTITTVKLVTISSSVTCTMSVMAGCGVFLALGFLCFNVAYRSKRVIKMSSPYINNIMVCGCIVTYTSVICNGLDRGLLTMEQFTQVCQTRPWILALGFTLSFGSMFSKTWRVYTVFTNKAPIRKSVRDHQLFTMVGVMVTVDMVILITWQVMSPTVIQDKVVSVEMISGDSAVKYVYTIQSCYSHQFQEFAVAIYAYKGLLLLFGTFLTWQTRSVQIPGLNDSKYVGMSLYNVVIFSVIGLPISVLLRDNLNAVYVIIGGFILFCTTATLLLLFVPKVLAVRRGDDGLGRTGSIGVADSMANASKVTSMNTVTSKMETRQDDTDAGRNSVNE
ncbi:gamma-aminobutyric acid type B receptor subunit 2-like [Ptychodera flava]|uniref:gamma-aminobutyric acid type B receptor subunit 2-like n=1 Tax=Ptychodera flava TaxID=63121 RepID=UPI00396A6547